MKHSTFRFSVILAVLAMFTFNAFATEESEEKWDDFSKNLVKALTSENNGIQKSAMQMVIKHGDKVDVNDAAYDVLYVFRTDENQKVRQLALSTLAKINNDQVNYLLERQIKFEADPVIRKQLEAISATK